MHASPLRRTSRGRNFRHKPRSPTTLLRSGTVPPAAMPRSRPGPVRQKRGPEPGFPGTKAKTTLVTATGGGGDGGEGGVGSSTMLSCGLSCCAHTDSHGRSNVNLTLETAQTPQSPKVYKNKNPLRNAAQQEEGPVPDGPDLRRERQEAGSYRVGKRLKVPRRTSRGKERRAWD